ncbi:MAG: DUF58 domain-containing protein [Eubacterium sp.]|nr:DUF58 domain-containing protein [Eubacterium sp.]
MKRNRIILAILWILSVVGISFFGGPVSYGLFTVLTLLPLISLIYLICVYFSFHIYQEPEAKHLVADHITPFTFILINEFHFGFVSVRVRFFSSFSRIIGLDDGVEYEFLPQTGVTKHTSLNCKYRGEYEIGIKTVELQDFFRLFRLSYRNREPRWVVVKPNTVELTQLRSVELSQAMARDALRNPSQKDIPVRKYEPGDDLRQVNWKATARSGELLVHGRIGEEREGITILLGTSRHSRDPLAYLPVENKMLETAIALTLFFVKKNIPVRSYHMADRLNEIRIPDLAQFEAYYERMSTVIFREQSTEDVLLREVALRPAMFQCKTVFMVLRDWSPSVLTLAKRLHENNVFTVVYLVRDDVPGDLPGERLPGVEIRCIPCDEDLTEVLG